MVHRINLKKLFSYRSVYWIKAMDDTEQWNWYKQRPMLTKLSHIYMPDSFENVWQMETIFSVSVSTGTFEFEHVSS